MRNVIEDLHYLYLILEFLLKDCGTLSQVAVGDKEFVLNQVDKGMLEISIPRLIAFPIVMVKLVRADGQIFVDVLIEDLSQLDDGLNWLQFDVEPVKTKIEYFKTGDLEKEKEWIFQDTVESLPQLLCGGYFLFD